MKDEQKIGMINAVMLASEDVISRAKGNKGTILLAKETAYDQIKQIIGGCCPWQEDWGDNPYQE